MSNVSVLIVGAGPTGLMMAYELARHGISFRIIDEKEQATQTSNAAAIQTRTLEIFKQLGLVDEFLRQGQPLHALCFHDKGKEYTHLDFTKLDSVYHYILGIPQCTTERILESHLNQLQHTVERSRELVDLHVTYADIEAGIRHHDGVREVIHCHFLIGCDGAHSTVRKAAGFEFPGEDLTEQFVVADGVMDSFLRHDQIHIFSADGYMLGVFPIGENKYRLGGNLQLGYKRQLLTENDIRELVAARSYSQYNARTISTVSPFWIHSKMANRLRDGNIFLLGDAAHIHSPVGGQGMNTGLQDAHNLAWKLALVIQGRADSKLLDSFEAERMPVIKAVVDSTDRLTKLLLKTNPITIFIRKQLMRLVFAIPAVSRYITRRMTQLSIRYQDSIALDNKYSSSLHGPSVGERAPDVKLNHSNYFYDYINDTNHHILCFTGEKDIFKAVDVCKQVNFALLGPLKDMMKLHLITPHHIDEPIDQLLDDNNSMHQIYQIKKLTLLVIRPDGYIAYKSCKIDIEKLKTFLLGYLQVE